MVGQLESKSSDRLAISPDAARDAVNRLFQSKYFAHAPKKKKFISLICEYYWQGRAAELNEYLIGREVFDRGDDYNPAADPIVRVSAHDVRKKLEQYYSAEGVDDPVTLMIPVGSYVPVFVDSLSLRAPQPIVSDLPPLPIAPTAPLVFPPSPTPERKNTSRNYRWLWAAGLITLLLCIVIAWQHYQYRQATQLLSSASSGNISQFGYVWNAFLAKSHPVLFVLSNPIVHKSVNESDPDVIASKGIILNKEQTDYLVGLAGNRLPTKSDSPIRLVPSANTYTGIGEAIGVFRLAQLLQGSGIELKLKQSRNVSPEDFRDYNVILLGSVYANQWSQPNSIKENFVYGRRATIENLNPQPGEEREYKPVFDEKTGSLLEDYALISVTPGAAGSNNIMLLAGIYSEGTQGVVEYITDKNGLQEIDQKLLQLLGSGSTGKYYQAVLKVKVENSFPTKTSLLAIRPLKMN